MKTRSKFSSLRSAICRSLGSNACASTPRSRKAPSTAFPESREISLSAERPPMSTATFPKPLPLTGSPSCITYDLHFALQQYAGCARYRVLYDQNQFFDVLRRRAAFVDDKICVKGRHLRPAYSPAFQAACLDQARRMVAGRIAEYRPRVGFGERLRSDTFGQQLFYLLAGYVTVSPRELEPCGDEKLFACLHWNNAAITDRILMRLANLQPACPVDGAHARDRIPCFRSIAAGIHGQRAADGAGNSGEKFRTLEVIDCGETRNFGAGDARLCIDLGVARALLQKEACENTMRKHDCSPQTPVPDQQIAAEADEENTFMRRQPSKKDGKVFQIGRRVSVIGGTSRTPADMLAHRLVALEFATQSVRFDLFQFCHIHASWLSFV